MRKVFFFVISKDYIRAFNIIRTMKMYNKKDLLLFNVKPESVKYKYSWNVNQQKNNLMNSLFFKLTKNNNQAINLNKN